MAPITLFKLQGVGQVKSCHRLTAGYGTHESHDSDRHYNFGTCACTVFCGSWLQYGTTGDEKRLLEQMDLLEGVLASK